MPSTRKKMTKDGREFYEIRVSRGRGESYLTTRWYVPDGWSRKAIERELAKQAAEFERQVKVGEVISKKEKKEKAAREKAEAEKIPSLKIYAETKFMPEIAVRCSKNSYASYHGNLDHWILPALGDKKMPEITAGDINDLLLRMQELGKAQSSCVKVYTVLQGIFKKAYRSDVIDRNPMDKVDRPRPRKDEVVTDEADKALTAQELRYVLLCAEKEPLKWQTYIALAADTGARRGELCGLKWKDIDWKGGTVRIRRNLQYTPKEGVYETSTKNRRGRVVDLGADTISLLRQLREEQADECLSEWVFTQDDSAEPMFPQSPTRYFKKFGERYGVRNFHPHLLRHTNASLALTAGADIKSTADRLGHTEAVFLRKYVHSNEESRKHSGQLVRDEIKKLS